MPFHDVFEKNKLILKQDKLYLYTPMQSIHAFVYIDYFFIYISVVICAISTKLKCKKGMVQSMTCTIPFITSSIKLSAYCTGCTIRPAIFPH